MLIQVDNSLSWLRVMWPSDKELLLIRHHVGSVKLYQVIKSSWIGVLMDGPSCHLNLHLLSCQLTWSQANVDTTMTTSVGLLLLPSKGRVQPPLAPPFLIAIISHLCI